MSGTGIVNALQAPTGFINGTPFVNNLNALQSFAVNLDKYETITQSLYDSASYATAGQNVLTFFQQAQGAGTGVISAAAKTLEDTNMQVGGQLPNQQAFLVTSVELDVQPDITFTAAAQPAAFGAQAIATSVNDVWKIRATGWLNFAIGQKNYLTEGPLMKYPASNDLEIDAAAADISTTGANMQTRIAYAKAVGPSYILAPNNLLLVPMQNFVGTLNWTTVETIASTARIFFRLMGQLVRSAQ